MSYTTYMPMPMHAEADDEAWDGDKGERKEAPKKKAPKPTPPIDANKQRKIETTVMAGNAAIEGILTKLGARPTSDFTCSIISKGRPNNVKANLALFAGTGVIPNFVVGVGEADAYRAQGARGASFPSHVFPISMKIVVD